MDTEHIQKRRRSGNAGTTEPTAALLNSVAAIDDNEAEFFDNMRNLASRMMPNPHYMDRQSELEWPMRTTLLDWVHSVHHRFHLRPEVFFLAANIVDRFLSRGAVRCKQLQLVGAAALLVAAKYDDSRSLTVAKMVSNSVYTYSANDFVQAEQTILRSLDYDLGWPGPMSFLSRLSGADAYDCQSTTLANYLVELAIRDQRLIRYAPDLLAAGAYCMARLMIYNGKWSELHIRYSNYTWSDLQEVLDSILHCCREPSNVQSSAYLKYANEGYGRASSFVSDILGGGFSLTRKQQTLLE